MSETHAPCHQVGVEGWRKTPPALSAASLSAAVVILLRFSDLDLALVGRVWLFNGRILRLKTLLQAVRQRRQRRVRAGGTPAFEIIDHEIVPEAKWFRSGERHPVDAQEAINAGYSLTNISGCTEEKRRFRTDFYTKRQIRDGYYMRWRRNYCKLISYKLAF